MTNQNDNQKDDNPVPPDGRVNWWGLAEDDEQDEELPQAEEARPIFRAGEEGEKKQARKLPSGFEAFIMQRFLRRN